MGASLMDTNQEELQRTIRTDREALGEVVTTLEASYGSVWGVYRFFCILSALACGFFIFATSDLDLSLPLIFTSAMVYGFGVGLGGKCLLRYNVRQRMAAAKAWTTKQEGGKPSAFLAFLSALLILVVTTVGVLVASALNADLKSQGVRERKITQMNKLGVSSRVTEYRMEGMSYAEIAPKIADEPMTEKETEILRQLRSRVSQANRPINYTKLKLMSQYGNEERPTYEVALVAEEEIYIATDASTSWNSGRYGERPIHNLPVWRTVKLVSKANGAGAATLSEPNSSAYCKLSYEGYHDFDIYTVDQVKQLPALVFLHDSPARKAWDGQLSRLLKASAEKRVQFVQRLNSRASLYHGKILTELPEDLTFKE